MTYIFPITDFRKNIFALTEQVARTGDSIEIEKEGKRIVKVVPIRDDASGKADHILTHVLPKLKGVWRSMTIKDIAEVQRLVRGRREKQYWRRPIFS